MVLGDTNRKIRKLEQTILDVFDKYGSASLTYAFGFIFLYYGLQKFIPGATPVRVPVTEFIAHFGIEIDVGSKIIGGYETVMGLLFFSKKYRAAFWMFLVHQSITLVSLGFIPETAFKNPWIRFAGMKLPYGMDWYAAYVLKNLAFIGGFMMLAAEKKDLILESKL